MRKILLLFGVFWIHHLCIAQALAKSCFEVHAGLGFGIYSMSTNSYESPNATAAPGLIGLGCAYQVEKVFGLGLDYERNGFVTDPDSNVRAVSHNFGVTASFNIFNREKNVIQAFLHAGISAFRFDNFNNQDYLTSSGSQVQVGMAYRHYFGGKTGIFFNFSIPYYSYNEFRNSKSETYKVTKTTTSNTIAVYESRIFQATMSGVNFRVGLTFKFCSS